jgi:hypothetical protein
MCKEGVLPELPCPHQPELSNHTREPSLCVLQVPLLFGKHPLIYMHVCIFFMVDYETMCSQSCVLERSLPVLLMGDMMEKMPHILVVPSPPTTIQVVLGVVVLRDRMDMMVDHLKYIEKLVCVCA